MRFEGSLPVLMKLFLSLILIVGLLSGAIHLRAQHGHLEAGASTSAAGSQLQFVNGDHFEATSGFVQPLVWAADGPYGGYYHGNITMTVRAATPQRGGPEPQHPALGTEVSVELLSIVGPPGGVFGFWEAGASEPTVSLSSGENGEARWLLSQNDGASGVDPFGHVHGRRFTATSPGIYTVSLRLHDESSNGLEGGSLHESSDPISIQFIAGDGVPVSVRRAGDYSLMIDLHEGSVGVVAIEDYGHTDHVHDALHLSKTIFEVSSHYRGYGIGHPGGLVPKGNPVWRLPARQPAHVEHGHDDPHGHEVEEADDSHHVHPDTMEQGHAHENTIEWDGGAYPNLNLEAEEDPNGGFNVYLNLSGFQFSPENASKHHIPGEGHAHIYVDGEKLGRVYNQAYFLGGLSEGAHHIRVTLNANSHEDYTIEGKLIESSTDVVVRSPGHGEGGHHDHHSSETVREWDGAEIPNLELNVVPDPASGWNLHFQYDHFELNPRQASRAHRAGEGHTHIYVNGVKLTRLYGNAYHLPTLPEGEVEVTVTLSSNDHMEYTLDGEPLVVVKRVGRPESEERHGEGSSVTLAWDMSRLSAQDVINVSIVEAQGPGVLAITADLGGHDSHPPKRELLASSHDGLDETDRFQLRQTETERLAWSFSNPGDYVTTIALQTTSSSGEALEGRFDLAFRVMPSSSLHFVRVSDDLYLNWDSANPIQSSSSVDGPFHELHVEGRAVKIDSSLGMRFYRLASDHAADHSHD